MSKSFEEQQTITAWTAANSSAWDLGSNWSGSVAPMMETENLKVVFSGEEECVLSDYVGVNLLSIGEGNTNDLSALKLTADADLLCGLTEDSQGQPVYIGYDSPALLTVENGAVFESRKDVHIGFSGTQNSTLLV